MIGVGPVEIQLDAWERTFGVTMPLYSNTGCAVRGVAIIDGVWVRGPEPLPLYVDAPPLPPDGPWLLSVVLRGLMWYTPPQMPKPRGPGIPGFLLGYYLVRQGQLLEDLSVSGIVERLLPRPRVAAWRPAAIRGESVDLELMLHLDVTDEEFYSKWALRLFARCPSGYLRSIQGSD